MANNKLSDEQLDELKHDNCGVCEGCFGISLGNSMGTYYHGISQCCDSSVRAFGRIEQQFVDTIEQLRTRCRELEGKCDSVMHRNAELQADLLDDKEKAAIRDLIAEHGIVDSSLWDAMKTQRDNSLARCQELEKRLFTKARFSKTHENAYTDEELLEMFSPFILEGCTTGLSPRECRLLETIADANAQLAAVTAERDELMSATLGLLASRDITWDNGRSGGHDWQHAVEQAIAATQQEASDDE